MSNAGARQVMLEAASVKVDALKTTLLLCTVHLIIV